MNINPAKQDKRLISPPKRKDSQPLILYKYISRAALEGLIQNGDFRTTYRATCNDPFEMIPSGRSPHERYIRNEQFGFISFSADSNNATLWGNYADKYYGALIEFEFDFFSEADIQLIDSSYTTGPLRKQIRQLQEDNFNVYILKALNDAKTLKTSLFHYLIIKCQYKQERADCSPALKLCHFNDEETIHLAKVEHLALMCTKGRDWQIEQEYRLVIHTKDETEERKINDELMRFTAIPTPYIKSIIIGPRSELTADDVRTKIAKRRADAIRPPIYIPDTVNIMKADYSIDSYKLVY